MQHLSETTALSSLMEQLSTAPTSSLLLDYDGTLAPFRTERHLAYPYPQVVPLLNSILSHGRSRVVIVTGRPMVEIEALLGPLQSVEIWGSHGLEHRMADGTYRQIAIDPAATELLTQAASWLTTEGYAERTEIKPGGLAVHWRGMSDAEIEKIREPLHQGLSAFAQQSGRDSGLKLLGFEGGLELRVAHPNKGDAVTSLLGGMDHNTPIVYLGDDLTDEDAFKALPTHGLGILVRPELRETNAQLWLRPPDELIDFLQQWLKSTSSHQEIISVTN